MMETPGFLVLARNDTLCRLLDSWSWPGMTHLWGSVFMETAECKKYTRNMTYTEKLRMIQ